MWRIWIKHFDENGKQLGACVYPREYKHKSSAVSRARRIWGAQGENKRFEWVVSKTNPWR